MHGCCMILNNVCGECRNEIAEKIPGVIVVDNEDFRNDTLTGGDTSHRTNVMHSNLFLSSFLILFLINGLQM